MTATHTQSLLEHRQRVVAKSLYESLRNQGFTHQQILELTGALVTLVTEELRTQIPTAK